MRLKAWMGASLLVVALATTAAQAQPAGGKPRYGDWGYEASAMDPAVRPGDDFFRYVNGAWLARAQIPPDRSFVGFDLDLIQNAEKDVRVIAEDAARTPHDATERQIGDLYSAWMDEAGVEAKGAAPLKPYLDRIAAVRTRTELIRLMGQPEITAPIGVGIQPDYDDPTRYVVDVGQSGLGLPNRDYYLLKGEKYDAFRTAYKAYVAHVLTLAGIPDADAKAEAIFALETRIATVHWAPERLRDIKQINNPMDIGKLEALAPQYEWRTLFTAAGLPAAPVKIQVDEPSEVQATAAELDKTPLDVWKAYLAFHFVSGHASFLPKAFDRASWEFYSHTLNDVPEQRERWKRGVSLINGDLGEAVGRIYVQRHYPPEAERQMNELISNLRAAYAERFRTNTWMDEPTRRAALAKLDAFEARLGHPVKYIDYSPLKIERGDLFGDAVRSERFEWALMLSRYPKPVDRQLWDMTPQTVNAYYNPQTNQITFPAAILQPPYFDPNADPAANYGAIGAVIGHEMGHGFDDEGREFDGQGKVRDWWTPEAGKAFAERTARLKSQYDSYEPLPGLHVNGALTMGENIGDLGGVEAAYSAWRHYVAEHGEPKVIDGLTGDQRFFIAFAQAWQVKRRDGALRQQVLTDPHSPDQYRVDGVVRNVDPWYAAFSVKPDEKLFLAPDQRVHIW